PKCLVWLEGSERYIQGITFRNCYDGIHVTNGPVFIENCEFVDNGGYGVIWQSDVSGGIFRNCEVRSQYIGSFGIAIVGYGSDMIIEGCTFDGVKSYLTTVQNVNIIDCEMKNARFGLQLAASASAIIHGCYLHDFSIGGLELSAVAPHVDIYDSIIEGAIASVLCEAESTLFASGCEFYGGYDSVFWFQNSGPAVVQGCHLIPSGPLAIDVVYQAESYGPVVHDFTRNYWGTTDAAQVAEWIWDGNDDPSLFATVLYQPMANGPVGSETTSWGDLKALWR
ncbi:MAG: right-handed parallel beta-helix repeat-containing protein, partial [bacterium]